MTTSGQVNVRFAVQDAEVVRQALESLGKDGEAAMRKLDAAGKAPSAGLKTLSSVISDLKGQATGFAFSLGPVGTGLVALGPQGLVAAAALGAVIAAFGRFKEGAAAAAAYAREIKDGAEQAGLSIPMYQAVIDQVQQRGVAADKASTGLNKFAVESAAAANATGTLFEKLKELDPTLARSFALASDQGARLLILMQALAKVGNDVAARAALSNAAFGKGGVGLGTALADIIKTGGGLDDITARLQKIGIVIDKDVIEKQVQLGVQTEQLAKQISHNWDLAYANIWEWSKDSFASIFGFKSALAFSEWIRSFTNSFRSDAPEPGVKAAQIAAAADRGGSPTPLQITINPSEDSDYAKRQRAITALKLQIDTEREHIGLLGELATKDQHLKLAEDEVTLALLQRKPITAQDADAIKRAADARLAAAETAKRVQFGVASEDERRTVFVNDLNMAIMKGTVSEGDRTRAMDLYNKTLKETIEGEKVRASSTPQLTRLALDSANLEKTLDSELSGALRGSTTDLLAMAKGTETLGVGLSNLSIKLMDAVANAILMKSVVGPLANTLSGGLSRLFGTGSSTPGGSTGGEMPLTSARGNIFHAGNVVPFSAGGVIRRPTLFPMANGGLGIAREAGSDEGILPLTRINGKLGVYAAGGSGNGVQVVNNFTVQNLNGSDVKMKQTKNNSGGIDMTIIIDQIDAALAQRQADGTGITSKVLRDQFGVSRKFA